MVLSWNSSSIFSFLFKYLYLLLHGVCQRFIANYFKDFMQISIIKYTNLLFYLSCNEEPIIDSIIQVWVENRLGLGK